MQSSAFIRLLTYSYFPCIISKNLWRDFNEILCQHTQAQLRRLLILSISCLGERPLLEGTKFGILPTPHTDGFTVTKCHLMGEASS